MSLDKFQGDLDKALDVSSLKSELQGFVKDLTSELARKPDAAAAFLLSHLKSNTASIVPLLSAEAKRSKQILKTAKPLA